VPIITEVKDKIQKLTQQYNRLKTQIETTSNEEEVVRKTAESEKVLSQINSLRLTLAKLDSQQRQAIAQQTKVITKPKGTPPAEMVNAIVESSSAGPADAKKAAVPKRGALRATPEDIVLFEQRVSLIESSQKKTREQLQKFRAVKEDLLRSKEEAEKHAIHVAQQSHFTNERLQQQVADLTGQLELSQARYENLKRESDATSYQTERDINSLKEKLVVAEEKQNQLEKERARLFRSRGGKGFWTVFLIGLGISIICIATFLGIVWKTPWLDGIVCQSKTLQEPAAQEEPQ
jgi:hypothetical protein